MSSSSTVSCRAAVIWRENEVPRLEEIQVDAPKAGEVRVKMVFASICHTDVLSCRGFPSALFPRVLGHEGVGVVESVGEGVKQVGEGDVVIPTYLGECKDSCDNCRSGNTNLCTTYPLQALTGLMSDGTSRMRALPGRQDLYHLFSCSTWSEYTVLDANYLVKLDPRIPLRHATLLSCGFTTGFGAAWKEARVARGSSVAVLGLGAVGLGAVEGAWLQGAAQIIGVDINGAKRRAGEVFGMTHFVNPKEGDSVWELIRQLTPGGTGVDYIFECTGVGGLVNEAVRAAKVGVGKIIMLGAGTDKTVDIDFHALLACTTFKYAIFGGVRVQSDLPLIVRKCIHSEIQNLDTLLTHQCPLEDINTAFQMLKEPQCVKVLIKF